MASNAGSQFFTIYQDQYHTGVTETLVMETDIFNAASAGSITLGTTGSKGRYTQESFFTEVAGLIGDRNTGADQTNTAQTAVIDDLFMSMGENRNVKLDRRIGPVLYTLDSFRKLGVDPAEASFVLGQQYGKAMAGDYVDVALGAAVGAFALTHLIDATTATLNHGNLVQGIAAFGDQSKDVRAFVMNSKQYHDLLGQSIADKITDVASVAIYQGNTGTLGKPVIVTDSLSLVNGTTFSCLALTGNAVNVEENVGREIMSQEVSGRANLAVRIQGEYSYDVGLKGFRWTPGTLGNQVDAADVTTAANWQQSAASDKAVGGAVINTL